MQTSKKQLTLAKHAYVSGQPLSHSRPPFWVSWCMSIFSRRSLVEYWGGARVWPKLCVAMRHTYFQCADTSEEKLTLAKHVYVSGQLESHSRPLLFWVSWCMSIFSRRYLVEYWGGARVWPKLCVTMRHTHFLFRAARKSSI